MIDSAFAMQSPTGGRQTKFTPANLRQITNLVERGKSREEIAEIIGVTPATLAVTCSRLKISLRRPKFDLGTGLLRVPPTGSPDGVNPHHSNGHGARKTHEQMEERSQPLPKATPKNEIEAVTLVSQGMAGRASNPASPKLSIQMQYKSEDRTFELPLNLDMVGRFAIEAEFRNMRIGELVARLILRIAEQDLFQLVLEQPDQEHDN